MSCESASGSPAAAPSRRGSCASRRSTATWVVWCRRPSHTTARVERLIERAGGAGAGNVTVSDDPDALREATFVVEAICEDEATKTRVLGDLGRAATDGTILASPTSSLSVTGSTGLQDGPSGSSARTCSTRCRRWT